MVTITTVISSRVKIYMLFAGLGSVRIVKNCDRGLENAARGPFGLYQAFNLNSVQINGNAFFSLLKQMTDLMKTRNNEFTRWCDV